MKVHLIKKETIDRFAAENAQSKVSLQNWLAILRYVDWEKTSDMLATFNNTDILGNRSSRVVFDIGGNKYRVICKYFFGEKRVHLFVCWIGTHATYDKLCKFNKQFTINNY